MRTAIKHKKLIMILITAVIVLLLSLYLFFAFKTRVDTALVLYDALENTANDILDKINSAVSLKDISNSSFSMKLSPVQNKASSFSELIIVNDKKNKQLTADILNCRYDKDSSFSLSVFADNSKFGFNINDSPEHFYTADSDNFKKKWNNSIYSYFIELPSFCPNDMSYTSLNSLLTTDNIVKMLMALGIGDAKINASDFIYNIKVSNIGDAVTADNINAEHIRLTLSGRYCAEFIEDLSKSSAIAKESFVSSYTKLFAKNIKSLKNKDIVVEFIVADNRIYSAETSLDFADRLVNIFLKFDEDGISINSCDLRTKSLNGSQNNINFYISIDGTPRAVLSDKKTILAAAYLNNRKKGEYEINFSFLDYSGTPRLYHLDINENAVSSIQKNRGKNIYKLSLFDMYELYNEIRDYPRNKG